MEDTPKRLTGLKRDGYIFEFTNQYWKINADYQQLDQLRKLTELEILVRRIAAYELMAADVQEERKKKLLKELKSAVKRAVRSAK
jgi:hypothetical protein